jgi:hypothetical protein
VGLLLFFIHLFGFSVPADIFTAVTMKIVFWGSLFGRQITIPQDSSDQEVVDIHLLQSFL